MNETQQAVTPQELKRQYERDYYKRNRERIRENKKRYWQRKADAMNAAAALTHESEDGER